MLRIGICDDSADARDTLRLNLEKILREESEEIVYEFSTGTAAVHWLGEHSGEIDLLFLDVEMDGMNGMEAAERIRKSDSQIMIVFVTGYSDYVFDGYRVNALDYIIKPAGTERLYEVLERVREQLWKRADEMYLFKNTDGTFRLPISGIKYFYSDRRKVILVYGNKEYAFYGKLDDVENKLSGRFVRIHQRFLVNAEMVVHIGSDHVTVDGKELPMSRALREEATVKLAKFMLGGVDKR